MISAREAKTFRHLYLNEDISVLSAFEVFSISSDLPEFVESLKLINQQQLNPINDVNKQSSNSDSSSASLSLTNSSHRMRLTKRRLNSN